MTATTAIEKEMHYLRMGKYIIAGYKHGIMRDNKSRLTINDEFYSYSDKCSYELPSNIVENVYKNKDRIVTKSYYINHN